MPEKWLAGAYQEPPAANVRGTCLGQSGFCRICVRDGYQACLVAQPIEQGAKYFAQRTGQVL